MYEVKSHFNIVYNCNVRWLPYFKKAVDHSLVFYSGMRLYSPRWWKRHKFISVCEPASPVGYGDVCGQPKFNKRIYVWIFKYGTHIFGSSITSHVPRSLLSADNIVISSSSKTFLSCKSFLYVSGFGEELTIEEFQFDKISKVINLVEHLKYHRATKFTVCSRLKKFHKSVSRISCSIVHYWPCIALFLISFDLFAEFSPHTVTSAYLLDEDLHKSFVNIRHSVKKS